MSVPRVAIAPDRSPAHRQGKHVLDPAAARASEGLQPLLVDRSVELGVQFVEKVLLRAHLILRQEPALRLVDDTRAVIRYKGMIW